MTAEIIPLRTGTYRFACRVCGADVHGFGDYNNSPEPGICIGCTIQRVRDGNPEATEAIGRLRGQS